MAADVMCSAMRVVLRFWAVQHGHRTIPIEMGSSEDDATGMALQQSTVSEG